MSSTYRIEREPLVLKQQQGGEASVTSWEIPRLTTGHVPTWSASGRRGVVADDARAWEVGLRHSVCLTVDASAAHSQPKLRKPTLVLSDIVGRTRAWLNNCAGRDVSGHADVERELADILNPLGGPLALIASRVTQRQPGPS